MTTLTISNTTASLIRRSFAHMDKATALSLFSQVLDTKDESDEFAAVDAAVHAVLTEQNGVLIKSEEILELIRPQVADVVPSPKRLNALLRDVLAQPEYTCTRGRFGGIRLTSAQFVSQAKPKASKASARKGLTLTVEAPAQEPEVEVELDASELTDEA